MNGTATRRTTTGDGADPAGGVLISTFARSQFPFFFTDAATSSHPPPQVFFENAGGSKVAQPPVIDEAVCLPVLGM